MRRTRPLLNVMVLLTVAVIPFNLARADEPETFGGVLPKDAEGNRLNLDFETGTLQDWIAEGEAFRDQPIRGDTASRRRSDMHSGHVGEYWIGGFERQGDQPQGTLTSVPFPVTHPFVSFLIAGGSHPETRVEIVQADTLAVIFRASGDNTEVLKRVVVDMSTHQEKRIFLRLVDQHSGGWGHLNFDDFRFHETRPNVPPRPGDLVQDVYEHSGLAPEEAASVMTVPEGFSVTLAAGEPDIVRPIAMTLDDRGRVWVAENHAYPFKVPDEEARDRILIFEDENGDGRFDSRKVFYEGLNMVTGLEIGFGGVWVGAAPELLFIPDEDGDDEPDGEPVVLLDGWGLQDTHETLNSFMWGPDGWLYGTHGVFTHSRVGKPGTPDKDREPINAGIWRYHPQKHEFEVFAQGTSNPWGLDFNEHGQMIIEACVIPHFFHIAQGGRYQRQAGQHFNPHTYADIQHHGDHVHWVGDNPHRGNDRSDSAGGGHAHSGLMVYLGGAWPQEYQGSIFMNNIHGARLNRDIAEPAGSGFIGRHAPDFLLANDRGSQIMDFRYGPDGNVWMIDWYDLQQCHVPNASVHDKTKGRIFKVTYGEPEPAQVDLRQATDEELMDQLLSVNNWYIRHALRVLQERGLDEAARTKLAHRAFEYVTVFGAGGADGSVKIRAVESERLPTLWALHLTGGLSEEHIAKGLADEGQYMRAWTIQLAMEDKNPSEATLARFIELAENDPSPVVRLYLASALQRMPVESEIRWAILENLVMHAEDADDHNLPLMYWYALEPSAVADPGRALSLASRSPVAPLLSYTVRRVGAIGTPEALALLVVGLGVAEESAQRTILEGINQALEGRRQVAMPANWPAVFADILKSEDARIRSQGTALALTFGDPSALEALRGVVADPDADLDRRREALTALRNAGDTGLPPILQGLLNDAALRGAALRGLSDIEHPETPGAILSIYPNLPLAERRDALNTLAARVGFARELLAAVGEGKVASADLSADIVRQLRNLGDEALNDRIAEVWGQVRETTEDKEQLIVQYKEMLTSSPEVEPDLLLGRSVFDRTCAQCHQLFGTGSEVGPELTGSNRADLDYVLSNVLDPSALIGKDYQAHLIATTDGRILTGIIGREDADSITLATANETIVLPLVEVEERQLSDQSMMPDDLWTPLSEHEVRSLVAYLASPSQVPALATEETASSLFNGKDLTGWKGNENLWSVEDGEIVGRSPGLQRNEFLRSELAAEDFRLSLKVKLTPNAGNSGIQFRSEELPEGEVKGYQADIGAGWWGKLYEEHGRALLWDESGEEHLKPEEWNDYVIEAQGSRIRTFLNGEICVDLDDPQGARRGIFALQLHSGEPMEVRFKDLRLEVLEAKDAGD
ncbi:hypothetical protein BH23PLA1_BH23PLA1_27750 [soil metagenome]